MSKTEKLSLPDATEQASSSTLQAVLGHGRITETVSVVIDPVQASELAALRADVSGALRRAVEIQAASTAQALKEAEAAVKDYVGSLTPKDLMVFEFGSVGLKLRKKLDEDNPPTEAQILENEKERELAARSRKDVPPIVQVDLEGQAFALIAASMVGVTVGGEEMAAMSEASVEAMFEDQRFNSPEQLQMHNAAYRVNQVDSMVDLRSVGKG